MAAEIPRDLDGRPQAYRGVEAQMLRTQPDRPSAAVLFGPDYDPELSGRLLGLDTSFVTQLGSIQLHPEELDPDIPPPDGYLATAYGAIPVLDSLRGALNTLGLTRPYLGHIKADRNLARTYMGSGSHGREFNREVERLQTELAGATHVCIIEQYVDAGNVLNYANALLTAAGVEVRTAMRGMWYQELTKSRHPRIVDLDSATSPMHHEAMYRIGQKAAQKVVERPGLIDKIRTRISH